MQRIVLTSVLALCAAGASPAYAVNLIGQSVSANFSGPGGATNVVQFSSPQTVGAGVEFNGSFTDVFNQNWTLALDVNATGFSIDIRDGVNGNIRKSDGSELIRFNLSGLSGIGPIQFAGYSCTPPASFACGVAGGGPSIVGTGSDASTAFVSLSALRNGENYQFSFGSDVPEPASWALMIGGFGVAGVALRRRATKIAYA